MNYTAQTKAARAALASAAIAGMMLTAFPAHALVVFDDGQTHIINDDTYAFEHIQVRNHSTLVIADGAVISAPIEPAYDFASGLPVLEFSAAAIQVFDQSALIVEGGVFGGDRLGTPGPNFLDNWYSGSIAAFDQATVIIENGTFGQWAFRSGTTAIFDHGTLTVSGGTFTKPSSPSPSGLQGQAGGGRIELYGHATAGISEGNMASTITAADESALSASNGMFGGAGGGQGRIEASGFAKVSISGGHFGAAGPYSGFVSAADSAKVSISGGTFGDTGYFAGRINVSGSGAVRISGGQFNASTINVDAGDVKIQGCAFNLPFGKLWDTSTSLQGILANGDPIDVDITRADSPDAIVKLIEECDL